MFDFHHYHNLAYAMQFGQPLILDVGFGEHLADQEMKLTVKQLQDVIGKNRSVNKHKYLAFCHPPPPRYPSLGRVHPRPEISELSRS